MANQKYLYYDGFGLGDDAALSTRWWFSAVSVLSVIATSNTKFEISYMGADGTQEIEITHTANVAGNSVASEQVAQQILDVLNTSYTNGVAEVKLAGGQKLTSQKTP